MTTSIPLSAKSLRVGMTVLAYTERSPFVIRKITPIKDGKRIRLFWKGHKFAYWDVYLENVIPVATNEQGRVTFDKEVMGDSPESGALGEIGPWVKPDESDRAADALDSNSDRDDAPNFSRPANPIDWHEKCRARENDLERQINGADEELHEFGLEVSRLTQKLDHEKAYSSALEKLVLTKFTKEELLSMALGRQTD